MIKWRQLEPSELAHISELNAGTGRSIQDARTRYPETIRRISLSTRWVHYIYLDHDFTFSFHSWGLREDSSVLTGYMKRSEWGLQISIKMQGDYRRLRGDSVGRLTLAKMCYHPHIAPSQGFLWHVVPPIPSRYSICTVPSFFAGALVN